MPPLAALRAGARSLFQRLPFGSLLIASAGVTALGTMAVMLMATWLLTAHQAQRHTQAYANTIAARLAATATEPLMNDAHIALKVVANEFESLDRVAGAAVYSADRRLLTAAGERMASPRELPDPAGEAGANAAVHAIPVDNAIAGYARAVVEPAAFAPPGAGLLALVGLVASTLAMLLVAPSARRVDSVLGQLRALIEEDDAPHRAGRGNHLYALAEWLTPEPERDDERTSAADIDDPPYVLVANVFNQQALEPADRRVALDTCLERVHEAAALYNGFAEALPGTGTVALLEAHPDAADTAVQAVCAALLARRLLVTLNEERVRSHRTPLALRLGLDRADIEQDAPPAEAVASQLPRSVQRTVLLSAVGGDDGITVGQRLLDVCSEPADLTPQPIDSPALRAMDGGDPLAAWRVQALPESYRAQLDSQAELLQAGPRQA